MKLLDALENIDIGGCTIGECHKIKSHDIELYNEKYVVNIKKHFFILLTFFVFSQNSFSQEFYISGRNSGISSINKVNLANNNIQFLHNIIDSWGLADVVIDKSGLIYASTFNHFVRIIENNPPLPFPNYVQFDTLVSIPNNGFIGCLAIDCNNLMYLGDNTNYLIYTYNLKTGELKNLGFYNAFFCDFEFYNGYLYAQSIENRNFTGKNYLMKIHLEDLSVMDTIMEIDNNIAVNDIVAGMATVNDNCSNIGFYAPRLNQYIKYNVEQKSYDVIPFNKLYASGAGSTSSWLGSYAPLGIDSMHIVVDWSHCSNPYSIHLFKKRGCCIRPGIEYSLDGVTFQSDSTFSDLTPGRYVVHIKDSLGCYKMSDTIVLKERSVVSLQSNKATCGLNNGNLIIKKQDPTLKYALSIDGSPFSTVDSISGLAPGPHHIIIEYDGGCRDTTTVTIDAQPLPDFSITQTISDEYCDKNNGSAHIVSADLSNIIYYSTDGINYTKDSINLNNLIAGDYPVYLKHQSGCLDTIHFEIKSFPSSVFNNIQITPASCNVSDGIIAVTSSQTNDTISLNGIASPNGFFDHLAQGNYTIQIKNNVGCITDSIVFLPGKNLPVIENIYAEDAHCNENNGSITVESSQPTDQYSLDGINYQSSNLFDRLPQGHYNIFLRNIEGCIEKSNTEITQTGLPVIDSLVTTDESCYQNNGAVHVYTSGNDIISYTLNDEIQSNTSSFDHLTSGVYTLTLIDRYGCEQTAGFAIQNTGSLANISALQVRPGDCTDPVAGVSLPLNTSDIYSIVGYVPGSDGVYHLNPGTYTVHIQNNVCSRDTILLIPPVNCQPFVPNVFSPNGDGINDVFKVEGTGFDIVDFRVFNRWGGVLYSGQGSTSGWDGLYRGKAADLGVYTYLIKVRLGQQEIMLKGSVTLVR